MNRAAPTLFAVYAALGAASFSGAAERRIPFWPDAVPETIHRHVDGVATLETVRELARFHRVQGSPGFEAAAEHLRAKAEAAGLSDARVERFPADGTTRYAHFRSYLGWEAREGLLEQLAPDRRVITRYPELPVALADYSQDADVTADLVDVGRGVAASDYEGKDVSGRILIASGPLPAVHRQVLQRGARGFVSDYPNQTTPWSGDDRDLVRWGHLSPYETKNTFAFMVSRRQADALRATLRSGATVRVRALVRARMRPATYDLVSASIPGADPAAGDVLLTAHLCHQSAGANDNASGSAAIFEVARALAAAVADGTLPAPRRTIRFLWAPEIAGTQAWMVRHPEIAGRLVGAVHMDMVGGTLAATRGTLHVSRSAESLPHAVNAIARAWLEEVQRASARHAERGGDPFRGFVWPPGAREALLADLRGLELGSDHQVLQAAPFRVPTVYFHDYPDVTIHTNKDQPENLDATKLGRVAYMGAGIAYTLAALPDAEARILAAAVRADGQERLARAQLRAALAEDPHDAAALLNEARALGREAVQSVARLWPAAALEVARVDPAFAPGSPPRSPAAAPPRDPRVPVRRPEIQGPIDVYYYDHFTEVLGPDAATDTALTRGESGELLAYEALNLVDGRRSVAEIRDVLRGRYGPVGLADVSEYFDLLARTGVITWGSARP